MKLLKLDSGDFDLSLFLNCEHKKYISNKGGLLNVVVGWSLAKEMGASIRNHKIDENTYWTFLPTEKRKIFQEHLEEFRLIALNKVKKGKKLIDINPLDNESKESLILFIQDELAGCIGYLFKNKLYIYNGNSIYHLDIGLLTFMSWDIIDNIKNMIEIRELIEQDYSEYLDYLDIKYIPYLLNAEENTFSRDVC